MQFWKLWNATQMPIYVCLSANDLIGTELPLLLTFDVKQRNAHVSGVRGINTLKQNWDVDVWEV